MRTAGPADFSYVPIRVDASGADERIGWAEGLRFRLPRSLVESLRWADLIAADGQIHIGADTPPAGAEDAMRVREHAAFTDNPPMSSRLPVSYRRVPARARAAVARFVGSRRRRRIDRWAAFPGFPLDLTADLVADLACVARVDFGGRTPVLLTHDIDSAEGLRNLVADFLPIEEAAAARSTNYVVPCAWTLDEGLLGETRRRGHDLAVHGYDHSNRTPFADASERARRLDAARPFMDRYQAIGYRAPSLLRTRALVRDVAERFLYDSSIPTSGGLFPVPNSGCATARPFIVEGAIELPVTLPRDGSLRFLDYSPAEIFEMWTTCANAIARSGGIVVLLTHCEARFSGNREMLRLYARFIEFIVKESARFAFSTPPALLPRIRASS